jgi:hypothetical protein
MTQSSIKRIEIKQYLQLTPLLVLTLFSVGIIVAAFNGVVVVSGKQYPFSLSLKHYLAFVSIAVNFICYFFFRSIYKYALLITIVVGLFNLINFTAVEHFIGLRIGKISVSFQPTAFLGGLLAYFLNFNRVNSYLIDLIAVKRTPEEQEKFEKKVFAEGVEKFRNTYRHYSSEALTEIVEAKKFVPEALEAARQILEDRVCDNSANVS